MIGQFNVKIKGDNSEFKKAAQDTVKSIGELKQEYRRLSRTPLTGMSAKEIDALNVKLGKLKDQIGDTQKTINSLSLDPFERMGETIQAASTIAGGITGAMMTFGSESEEAQKLMQKTIGLMAIAKAAQEAVTFANERAAGIYLKNKYAEINANLKSILTIKTQTAATIEQTAANTKLSAGQKIIIALQNLWNKTVAANPVIAIVAAVAALTTGIYLLARAYMKSNDDAKGYEKTLDGLVIKDEKLRDAHNEHVITMKKLQNEWDALTGAISPFQRTLRDLAIDYEKSLYDIRTATEKQLEDVSGKWYDFNNMLKSWVVTKGFILEQEAKEQKKIIEGAHQQQLDAQQEYQKKIKLLQEQERIDTGKAMAELAVLQSNSNEERLAAQIEASRVQMITEISGLEEGNAKYELAVAQHNERVNKLRKDAAIKSQEQNKARLEAEKKANDEAFAYMLAESAAYWQRLILESEQMGKNNMDAQLALIDVMTEEKLKKVNAGSEQEAFILKQAESEKAKIMRQGFAYQIEIQTAAIQELQQRLAVAADMNKVYGDSFDYIGEQMAIYKAAIDAAIEAGGGETEMVKGLIDAYNALKIAKEESIVAAEKNDAAIELQKNNTEQLQQSVTDLASAFGAAAISMVKDGKEATSQILKQALAQVIGTLIKQIMATMPFPSSLVLAAGAGALGQALFNQIPAFAEGGAAFAPTLAVVGDNPGARTNPEIIAPLSKVEDMVNGTGGDMSKVEFVIRGDVLYGILDKYAGYKQKYK